MSALVELTDKNQITLPGDAVTQLKLKAGDWLEVEIKEGKVIITPVTSIPNHEQWVWQSEIMMAIKSGRREAKDGKLKVYDSVDEMMSGIEQEEDGL